MDNENTKRKKKGIKNSESYEKSNKFKKCDDLFIDLNKKKDFNERDLKKIRHRFIQYSIVAFISKFTFFIISHLFLSIFFIYLFVYIAEGSFSLMSIISSCILSLLFCGIYKLIFKKLNKYATLIRISNKISMVTTSDLIVLDNKEINSLLTSEYFDALGKALNTTRRPVKFSTHELIRIKVSELYEDNLNYNFECIVSGIKPIKEFMIIKSLKHLVSLYKYINFNGTGSKEFNEVTRLLRASYTYDISISNIQLSSDKMS